MIRAEILFLGTALGVGGCASASGYAPGKPCEVLFRDYRSQVVLGLASESKTSREMLYSNPAANPAIKVISDSLMESLIGKLDSLGFFQEARTGGLPPAAPGAAYGIEVEVEGSSRHLLRSPGTQPRTAAALSRMFAAFREIYDGTFQAQRVESRGPEFFKAQQVKAGEKKKDGER